MKYSLPEDIFKGNEDNPLLLDTIADRLGLKTVAGKVALRIALENICMLDKKQQDYGSRNISKFLTYGVAVRLNDKVERINNLVAKKRKPRNESLEDSFRDASNYGIIGVMCLKGEWPNE
jgi:hypothetical protein